MKKNYANIMTYENAVQSAGTVDCINCVSAEA